MSTCPRSRESVSLWTPLIRLRPLYFVSQSNGKMKALVTNGSLASRGFAYQRSISAGRTRWTICASLPRVHGACGSPDLFGHTITPLRRTARRQSPSSISPGRRIIAEGDAAGS